MRTVACAHAVFCPQKQVRLDAGADGGARTITLDRTASFSCLNSSANMDGCVSARSGKQARNSSIDTPRIVPSTVLDIAWRSRVIRVSSNTPAISTTCHEHTPSQ